MSKEKEVAKYVATKEFDDIKQKAQTFEQNEQYRDAVSILNQFMKDQEANNNIFNDDQKSEILKLRAKCNYNLNNFIEVLDDYDELAQNNDPSIAKSISSEMHYITRDLFMKYNNDI